MTPAELQEYLMSNRKHLCLHPVICLHPVNSGVQNFVSSPELITLRDEGTHVRQANIGSIMDNTSHTLLAYVSPTGEQGMQIWVDAHDEDTMVYLASVWTEWTQNKAIDQGKVQQAFQTILEAKLTTMLTQIPAQGGLVPAFSKGFAFSPRDTPKHIASFITEKLVKSEKPDWDCDEFTVMAYVLHNLDEFQTYILRRIDPESDLSYPN